RPDHAPRSRGRGDRAAPPAARRLERHRVAGVHDARSVSLPATFAARAPVALYIHIPFCVSLCPYCDFVVYAGAAARGPRNRVAAFLAALETELELRAAGVPGSPGIREASRPLETIYFGGGTPSLLPPEAIARLLDRIRARFGLAAGAEVTLEANPGPDERGDATAWREAGVTRI